MEPLVRFVPTRSLPFPYLSYYPPFLGLNHVG
jgi:hypothetical protein